VRGRATAGIVGESLQSGGDNSRYASSPSNLFTLRRNQTVTKGLWMEWTTFARINQMTHGLLKFFNEQNAKKDYLSVFYLDKS